MIGQESSWPRIKLKTMLRYLKDRVDLDEMSEYVTITVKRRHGGLQARERLFGHQIRTKKQFRLSAGAFIISRIQCWHQAYAIVPDDVAPNMIASTNYDQFVISPDVDHRFFWWLTYSPLFTETVRASAFGVVVEKMVFNRDVWLEKEIPLPPLAEQRRIAARIEQLRAKIDEAHVLRKQTLIEEKTLYDIARRSLIGEAPGDGWVQLGTIVETIENGRSPACEPRPASLNEWGVLKVGAISFGTFNERQNKALPRSQSFDPSHEVKPGDFLMSRANTPDLVGACAIVHHTRSRLLLSDKTFRFHFRPSAELIPAWLEHVMKSHALSDQITRAATGTSPTMKNISKEKVMNLLVPPHREPEQLQIVAKLDALEAKVEEVTELQSETATEIEALLPSILDKAFSGAL